MAEMHRAQLRSISEPLALRVIEFRLKVIEAQTELLQLLQDLGAPDDFAGAMLTFAQVKLGARTEHSGAEMMSRVLGLKHIYCSAAAQAISPAQQMELMLQGRFEAAVKGS